MVLVTGGAGLLGNALIRQLLAEGMSVKAIYHKTVFTDIQHNNFTAVKADILDVITLEEVMQGINEIYHCAGLVSFAPEHVQLLYKINVEGTANIINAALAAGVRKIVHVSSVAALGRLREGQTINETMQWSADTSNSKYGHSKYLGEMEVWRGIAEGLDAVVVNPVIILGPANWNEGSTKIFRSVYEEFPYYTEGITGFVDVRDVAAAMILLMQSDVSGERFIISAENTSYRSVFNMIAEAFGKKLPHKNVTPFIANIFWRLQAVKSFFTRTKPLVTRETTATALAKVYFDNSKLLKAFPQFSYRTLKESITDTCKALQQKINKQ